MRQLFSLPVHRKIAVWEKMYALLRENMWFIPIVRKVLNPVIVPADSNFADIQGARPGTAISHAIDQCFYRK